MYYKYYCNKCEKEVEVKMSYKDLPLKNCPECNSEDVERVYSSVGQVWKTSGSYKYGVSE